MGNGIGTGKECAGFSILALAIAEKERVGSGITVVDMTGLSDETAGDNGAPIDGGTGADNEILGNHIPSDINRIIFIAVDAPVFEFHRTGDLTERAYPHVFDITHVHDFAVVFDDSPVRCMLVAIIIDDRFHPFDQFWTMAVKGINIGKMGGEFVGDMYFSSPGFVQHIDLHSVPECSHPVDQDHIYILDKAIITDSVVGYIILHILDHYIVADATIMNDSAVDAGMFL